MKTHLWVRFLALHSYFKTADAVKTFTPWTIGDRIIFQDKFPDNACLFSLNLS